ncbi:MAG: hypothetical protein ACK4UN_04105 [Limisphaerales bacterium]
MSASKSDSKQTQNTTQTTTQIDNRVGASDGGIVAQNGSSVTIQSMDAQTIAGALGLTQDVVARLSELTADISLESLGVAENVAVRSLLEMSDVSQHAMDRVSRNQEYTSAEMSKAFDRFGSDLTSLKMAELTGGASESNKLIAYIIVGAVILGTSFLFLFFGGKK